MTKVSNIVRYMYVTPSCPIHANIIQLLFSTFSKSSQQESILSTSIQSIIAITATSASHSNVIMSSLIMEVADLVFPRSNK